MIEHMFDSERTELIEQIRADMRRLATEDLDRRSNASLSAGLLERMALVEQMQAEVIRAAGQWNEAKAWKDDGALSGASWLARRTATTRARALRLLQTARHARSYERTAKALEAGDVSTLHVEIMAVAANQREEVFAEDEHSLLDIAATHQPDEFQVAMRHWCHRADERLLESGGFDASARCYLRGTPMLGSLVKIDGIARSVES
jgi:hypothetical protein